MDVGRELKKMESKGARKVGPEARRHIALHVTEIDLMNNSCGKH